LGDGYTLVICEKPDAARRISQALSGGRVSSTWVEGVPAFRFSWRGEEFVVCAAQGHLYSVSDPFAERSVYPVFDVEWYGSDLVEKEGRAATRRISAIRKLARGAGRFVNACDYDVEGETIGYNILRYACGGKERDAYRAKFSTLTKEELNEAFGSMSRPPHHGMASAGRARHLIDFAWGVNLSRVLSQSGSRYRTISIGRVQGPTLNFVVQREREIRGFVPRPFWTVDVTFEKDGKRIVAAYAKGRLDRKADAGRVKMGCAGGTGIVTGVRREQVELPPPPPFNIGDLQREAYRVFGYSPSRSLQLAERLYLDALVSYPRTGSQKLPLTVDCKRILLGLASSPRYSEQATELLTGVVKPAQGAKDDPAHPAIHPTGEGRRKALGGSEARIYDLIVRRFFAGLATAARREKMSTSIEVRGYSFVARGSRTVFEGWLHYYSLYGGMTDVEIQPIVEGDKLRVLAVEWKEKYESAPARYNQINLLQKMEREKIGTKATRADVIATLVDRGYMWGENLTASNLGFSVVETMGRYAPGILSTELTRSVEQELEGIEGGAEDAKGLVRATLRPLCEGLAELNSNEEAFGREIDAATAAIMAAKYVLGSCPVCGIGMLRMIRSKKTGKRFIGCTNYSFGCRASAPLPQRGALRVAMKPCLSCGWPVVYVSTGRFPWRLCVNPNCPSKGKKSEVPAL